MKKNDGIWIEGKTIHRKGKREQIITMVSKGKETDIEKT